MGMIAAAGDRRGALKITAVDARGLSRVSIVGDSEELATWEVHGQQKSVGIGVPHRMHVASQHQQVVPQLDRDKEIECHSSS
jgi:hypothetical protein